MLNKSLSVGKATEKGNLSPKGFRIPHTGTHIDGIEEIGYDPFRKK